MPPRRAAQHADPRYAIFLPLVRGTAIGSCRKQYLPWLYIDSRVPQPSSPQVRPFLYARDGRSFPDRETPPTDRSLMIRTNPHSAGAIPRVTGYYGAGGRIGFIWGAR